MPYGILNTDTNEIIAQYDDIPNTFDLPDGRRVTSPVSIGDEGLGHRFVRLNQVNFSQPGTYYSVGTDDLSGSGNDWTITRNWIPWTQPQIDAYEAQRIDDVVTPIDTRDNLTRGILLTILDEFNRHSAVETAILSAAASANTLANFKTSMAAITPIPTRTLADLKTIIRGKVT